MDLRPLTRRDVAHVVDRMRDSDAAEIYNTRWTDSPHDLVQDTLLHHRFSWIAAHDGEPIAVVGAGPKHPNCWSVHMYATDDFHKLSVSLSKFIRRVMIPALYAAGAHRAECASSDDHTTAHRWLEWLGARREAEMRGYGKDGQSYFLYAWSRNDVHGWR